MLANMADTSHQFVVSVNTQLSVLLSSLPTRGYPPVKNEFILCLCSCLLQHTVMLCCATSSGIYEVDDIL